MQALQHGRPTGHQPPIHEDGISIIGVLIAPPGGGKSTLGKELFKQLGGIIFDTGDLCRACTDPLNDEDHELRHEVGDEAVEIISYCMRKRKRVPDGIILKMAEKRLSQKSFREAPYIWPTGIRSIEQAQWLDLVAPDVPGRRVMGIESRVSRTTARYRLLHRLQCRCGETYHDIEWPPARPGICDSCHRQLRRREEDTEAGFSLGWHEYEAYSEPLLQYYANGRLIQVNGEASPQEITRETVEKVVTYRSRLRASNGGYFG